MITYMSVLKAANELREWTIVDGLIRSTDDNVCPLRAFTGSILYLHKFRDMGGTSRIASRIMSAADGTRRTPDRLTMLRILRILKPRRHR